MKYYFYPSLILLLVILSCGGNSNPKGENDTPTSGKISIGTDATLFPLANGEARSFETLCPNAHLNVIQGSESQAFELLLKDSVRMIFATREP
ncbi:MAG: phosphate ABC transporter substrate-binding protein, partial [Bacteroidetes bacterium]|nr:phosphate ABC transporter substrate-binding protein [Bacteroidota bacterium]